MTFEEDGVTVRLFLERGYKFDIYINRMPNKSGDPPKAYRIILMSLVAAACGFGIHTLPHDDPRSLLKLALYLVVLAAICAHICRQYSRVVVDRKTRTLNFALFGISWPLAKISELERILVLQQEYNGILHYCYACIWKGDRLRSPIRMSPICRSMNQLSRYQRSVIPKIRPLLPKAPDVSANESGEEDETESSWQKQFVVRNLRPKREIMKRTLWFSNTLSLAVRCLIPVAFFMLVRDSADGAAEYLIRHFQEDAFHLLAAAQIAALLYVVARLFRVVREESLKCARVVVNGMTETITVRTFFGLAKHVYRFEALAYISVKGFGKVRKVCLVIEDSKADVVIGRHLSTAKVRKTIKEVSTMFGVRYTDWVDLFHPIHEWRFNRPFNPYREWQVDNTGKFSRRKTNQEYMEEAEKNTDEGNSSETSVEDEAVASTA